MADTVFCSQCGTPMDAQARFCSKCGKVIVTAPATAPANPVQPAAMAAAAYGSTPPPPQAMATSAPVPPAMAPQPGVPQAYAPPPGYVGAAPLPYAGFWMRVGAHLLDVLILIIPLAMLAVVPGINFVAGIVGPWLYFALQESSERQATLGKMALKIYVTDMQGRRISFGQATGRHFGKILSALILCIGYMMAGFTAQKQALHDMMAGTLVKRR